MSISMSNSFYWLVLICATLFSPGNSHNHLPSSSNHVAMFIFGDSLFDAGNNNYLKDAVGRANFWPYGETFFKHATGRFTDGRIMPDFLAEYLKLPLIRPYLQPGNHEFTNGTNFASGGAGALVETHQGQVVDLKTQLKYFKNVVDNLRKTLGDAETKTLLANALYLFSIGGNDYIAPFTTNSTMLKTYSKVEYVGMVMGNLTIVIEEIYKNGGRHFLFSNMPPLGIFPTMKGLRQASTDGSGNEFTVLSRLHNEELTKLLKELQTNQLTGFKYSKFDIYTALTKRIRHPAKYGFKEGRVACCGSGKYRGVLNCGGMTGIKKYQLCGNAAEYLFFDGSHPSEKAYSQFAELIWGGNPHDIQCENTDWGIASFHFAQNFQ